MIKQLILCTDMEGASGIFEENKKALLHGSEEWRTYGRECMTSDVLAVCEAANEFGIDEILIYDGHFAGNPEHNILIERLPPNVRFFDTPDRCFFWRRIRGQAQWKPFGLITVGQHARYGEPEAYFAHTIQSPPIKAFYLNGIHIAEIGSAVLNFYDVNYIANIGCQASMKEARELSGTVAAIAVKDKAKGWQPAITETFPLIKEGLREALRKKEAVPPLEFMKPYEFSLTLMEGFCFDSLPPVSWKGCFDKSKAFWEAPSIEIGLELFNWVRSRILKEAQQQA